MNDTMGNTEQIKRKAQKEIVQKIVYKLIFFEVDDEIIIKSTGLTQKQFEKIKAGPLLLNCAIKANGQKVLRPVLKWATPRYKKGSL